MAYLMEFSVLDRYNPLFDLEEPPGFQVDLLWKGKRVDPDRVPKRAALTSRHKSIPDAVKSLGANLGMSEAFRGLVERLEPGVHQFFPIEIFRRRRGGVRETEPGSWYLVNVMSHLDAIIVERSNVTVLHEPLGTLFLKGPGPTRLTLDRRVIADRHLWRSTGKLPGGHYVSDALAGGIERAGMKGLVLTCLDHADV